MRKKGQWSLIISNQQEGAEDLSHIRRSRRSVVDFDAGVERLCGAKPSKLTNGKANLYSSINLEPSFYENLDWTKDGKELWDAIKPLKPHILTGHTTATQGPARKYAWCQRELGVETHHVKNKDCLAIELDVTNVFTCYQDKEKYKQSGPRQ